MQQSKAVTAAADKAVFQLQFNTTKAAKFVCAEVPGLTLEDAIKAINVAVKPQR